MATTSHYGLTQAPDDAAADWDVIDRELYRAATHHHTGGAVTIAAPDGAPTLSLYSATGSLAPATRYYYKLTFIDALGNESLASPEGFIDTQAQVASPAAPTLSNSPVGGALLSGNYYYALTAYEPDSSHETLGTNAAYLSVLSGSTNKNTITFPSLPTGAHGFNIYRQGPGGTSYFFLTSVPMNVATPPSSYLDDGSVAEDCDRSLPFANTTKLDQSIRVCVGGATPAPPAGSIWRIYRTAVSGNYAQSLLKTITDPSVCYVDTGLDTAPGGPPTQSGTTHPEKVLLTDAAEVQGTLPPANSIFRETVQFAHAGLLTATITGTFAWHCPYEHAKIQYVVASLGRNGRAAGLDVIVDVNKYAANTATPTWASIFTDPNRPTISSGGHNSGFYTPDITTALRRGDLLTVDVDQVSGGATPLDTDLLVQIVIWHTDSGAYSIVVP